MNLIETNLPFYPHSLVSLESMEYGLAQSHSEPKLAILAEANTNKINAFEGEINTVGGKIFLIGPLSQRNASALRSQLDWLQPRLVGRGTSAGMGDRIGLATPGHVRSVRAVDGIAPIFAQQSMREMARAGRTPQQVMDDATWGIFQEGWRAGAGADADHLKTIDDINVCLAAGFTFFTIDPGEYVDLRAEIASPGELRELADLLPREIQPHASGLHEKQFEIEGLVVYFDEYTLTKAVVKYGMALAHVAAMYRQLAKSAGHRPFELEVSVDETEQPTSHAEHFYIASELNRLGVQWISLAPRYVGRFEKGVDYIGDLGEFEHDFAGHAAIARHFGGYKLSLHSGSDKFSIYPIAARLSNGMVHLKTAGTSYLEALRTIATVDVDFFREIYCFAREHFEMDRATYHVSADITKVGAGLSMEMDGLPKDTELPLLLEDFHARQILHVTFGSVLTKKTADGEFRFHDRLISELRANSETYAANLEKHFIQHLVPFAS